MSSQREVARGASKGSETGDPGLARTLANPWRARILGELYLQPMSPSRFVEQIGGEISTISRHFRALANWGYIEVIDEKSGGRRRGGVEHIYRTTQRDHLDTETWATLPLAAREVRTRGTVAFLFRRISEAVDGGTFDAEIDRHLSWDAINLDRRAWEELGARLDQILAWLPVLEAQSAQRIAKSGEPAIPATVGLAAFRSPGEPKPRKPRAKVDDGD
jgi:DNA-binding transcriptional ArsR family regulator